MDRVKLLRALEAVSPGLSKKDATEQSSCFALVDRRVWTFNDEIACSAPSGLPSDFEGAVQSGPLLAVLRDRQEDEITVEKSATELTLKGKSPKSDSLRWEADVRMEAEVTLPVHSVERPGKDDWNRLPEDFGTAVAVVQECAGKDEQQFVFTCVHLHPSYVEACDNIQLTRYKLKTGVRRPVIVKRDSIRHVTGLDMTEVAETETWIHFRNPARVVLSCRRYVEEFPDLTEFLKVGGEPTVLPKGLHKDARFAEIFSKEVEDRNLAIVSLKHNRIEVRGIGVSGKGRAFKAVKYRGKPMAFAISPRLLHEITKRHHECKISPEHLRVDGDSWVFVTSLESPKKLRERAESAALSEKLELDKSGEGEDD